MKPSHKYATTAAFRTPLEDRLKSLAQTEAIDLQRLQRQVAFDRLLGRLFAAPEAPWLLKGGYAMELRMKAARATKDIDLALRQTPAMAGNWDQKVDAALELLEAAGQSESRPDTGSERRTVWWRTVFGRSPAGRQNFCPVSSGCEHRRCIA